MMQPEVYAKDISGNLASKLIVLGILEDMNWKKNDVILDFGCGPGTTTVEYLIPHAEEKECTLSALDISEVMIDFAKSNHAHPRVQYVAADLFSPDIPFKEQQFDHIFAFRVIDMIQDYRGALRQLYKFLKPGGKLAITVFKKTGIFRIQELIRKSEKWAPYCQGFEKCITDWNENNLDPEVCVRAALENAGFIIRKAEAQTRYVDYSPPETITEHWLVLMPWIKEIPENMLPEFKADVSAHVKTSPTETLSPDGTYIRREYELLIIQAEKPQ